MKKILIVEDDADLSNSIKYVLTKSGYTVFVAHDGAEGIALAQEKLPDVIIMDYMLPDIPGGDVVSTIKKHSLCKNTSVVFLTGLMSNRDLKEGIDTLIIDGKSYPVLAKPFDFPQLLKTIEDISQPG